MAMATPQMCSLGGYIDHDSHLCPRPPPVPMGTSSPRSLHLPSTSDLDLSLTPDRLGRTTGILKRDGEGGGRHVPRQVRFDVSPGSQAGAANLSPPQRDGPAISTVTTSGAHPQPRDSTAALFGRQEPQAPSKSAKYKAPKGDQDKIRKRHQEKQAVRETPLDCQSGVLAEGPELNTTLAVGVELRGVAEAEFDPKRAVQDQLRKSAHRKNAIEIRATEGVNIPRSQQLYRALVSVSVPEDELISEAVKERLLLAPPPRAHGNKESPTAGPDLLHFYSPSELLRETPFLPGEGVTLPRPRPVPRPSQATFDLYHKHRQWEA